MCSSGFYIKNGSRSTCHCNHIRRLPNEVQSSGQKLLDESTQKFISQLAHGHATPAIARNLVYANHNVYLKSSFGRRILTKRSFCASGSFPRNGQNYDAASLVEFLRDSSDLNYCIWGATSPQLDRASAERAAGIIFNETRNPLDDSPVIQELPGLCDEALAEYTAEMLTLNLSYNQNLFIACAWMSLNEKNFRTFPHVLKFDVTMGTNNEKRPLMTVSMFWQIFW